MAGEAFALSQEEREAPESRAGLLARLERQIARIEDRGPMLETAPAPVARAGLETGGADMREGALRLGIELLDRELAHAGITAAGLHEIRAASTLDIAAATGFALALAARAAAVQGGLFWIAPRMARLEAGLPFGPGIEAFGLDPSRLVRVEVDRVEDALWAAGEVTASRGAPGANVCLLELRGNPAAAGLVFTRRLALRARDNRVPVILLRQAGEEEASAALTRWRLRPASSRAGNTGPSRKWVGLPTFRVTLEKCRGGRQGDWIMEWNNDERLFALAGSQDRHTGHLHGTPLSRRQPAEALDRPDHARPSRSGLARRRAS